MIISQVTTANTDVNYKKPEEVREEAIQNTEKKQKVYKRRYDQKRYEGLEFDVGDIVVIKRAPEYTGQPTKT